MTNGNSPPSKMSHIAKTLSTTSEHLQFDTCKNETQTIAQENISFGKVQNKQFQHHELYFKQYRLCFLLSVIADDIDSLLKNKNKGWSNNF